MVFKRGFALITRPGDECKAAPVVKRLIDDHKSGSKTFYKADVAVLLLLVNLHGNAVFHVVFKVNVRS